MYCFLREIGVGFNNNVNDMVIKEGTNLSPSVNWSGQKQSPSLSITVFEPETIYLSL